MDSSMRRSDRKWALLINLIARFVGFSVEIRFNRTSDQGVQNDPRAQEAIAEEPCNSRTGD